LDWTYISTENPGNYWLSRDTIPQVASPTANWLSTGRHKLGRGDRFRPTACYSAATTARGVARLAGNRGGIADYRYTSDPNGAREPKSNWSARSHRGDKPIDSREVGHALPEVSRPGFRGRNLGAARALFRGRSDS